MATFIALSLNHIDKRVSMKCPRYFLLEDALAKDSAQDPLADECANLPSIQERR